MAAYAPALLYVITVLAVVLQSSLVSHLQYYVMPDLIVTTSICMGLVLGTKQGLIQGMTGGLLQGMLDASPGSFAASRMITGYLAGIAGEKVFHENWIVPPLFGAVGTVVAEGVFLIMNPSIPFVTWLHTVSIEAGYNALLAVPICALLRSFTERFNFE